MRKIIKRVLILKKIMREKTALQVIGLLSLAGVLFSGYLSYTEIFAQTCALGVGTCSSVFTIPACVYGLIMYLIILIISITALYKQKR
jgi:NADH:ubiquinone oxidoreductase subunit 5 (subunit L)/multisubunit Na+/H+ antiporter MnhA subunit